MKVTYDKEADAMYVYFEEPRAGSAKYTVALNDDIIVDFDKDKKIIGIEILSASQNLSKRELKEVQAAKA